MASQMARSACLLGYVLLQILPIVQAGALIHGYSVVIQPPLGPNPSPRNANFITSNFFSYASPAGYLSFGWFMPAGPETDTSHCIADTDNYDFYEYSSGDCKLERCLVYVKNYNTSHPQTPAFETQYDARTVKVGDEPNASLAVSFFDEEDGAYAVGSRTLLGIDQLDVGHAKECNEAFATLERIEARYNVPISFALENPCVASQKGQEL